MCELQTIMNGMLQKGWRSEFIVIKQLQSGQTKGSNISGMIIGQHYFPQSNQYRHKQDYLT